MLKLGVVGAGIMGANHVRVSGQLRDAVVTWVVDAEMSRAQAAAAVVGASASTSLSEVIREVDAVVIATPTASHEALGLACLRAGVHVLVEKPIATDTTAARRLVEVAEDSGLVLQVGHVERFNPAVLELDNIVRDVIHIAVERISPYSARIGDGVIMDLMIHDLDLVRAIVGSEIVDVAAVARTIRSETEDLASAVLTFENGATATLTASRIGQNKIRTLEITQPHSFVTVDLLRQDVTINRVDHSEYLSDQGARYRQTGVIEVPFLEHRGEPLLLELASFVRSVTTDQPPRVSGADGLAALELAETISREAVRS
jgi:predicted dehydrogenase